jgi:GNAT superfamily N-acetyltransferase
MTSVIVNQAPGSPLRDVAEVTIRRLVASDTGAVMAMLRRCSRTSLFHRFHGFTDGVVYFQALLRDRPDDQTLLARSGSTCVGVATLGVSATGIVDLGVLVEDAWQRRGIGTCLTTALLDGARAEGVTLVHADVLNDDVFILKVLRRIAPLTVATASGSISVAIDLSGQPRRPPAAAVQIAMT